jgi:hypothetical protein
MRVEVAGGLVVQDHRRDGDDRAGDRQALLLTAGQFAGAMVDAVTEPDPGQRLDRFFAINPISVPSTVADTLHFFVPTMTKSADDGPDVASDRADQAGVTGTSRNPQYSCASEVSQADRAGWR